MRAQDEIDDDKSGSITEKELKAALTKAGEDISDEDLKKLISMADTVRAIAICSHMERYAVAVYACACDACW